tara:strand:- start:1311 stop:1646 length:336 start_codon:yes stop_codon:yes gene_type:complete
MFLQELKIPSFQKIDFDLVEDAIIYMQNDPLFYRKEYYPVVSRLADAYRDGKSIDSGKYLKQLITNGVNSYCKKYKLANMPDDIFNESDKQKILDKIFSNEIENIRNGDYS